NHARRTSHAHVTTTVDPELRGLDEQYNQGGIRRLVAVIDYRSRRAGSNLYLVTARTGEGVAGNIASPATGVLDRPGWVETGYRRLQEPEGTEHHALARVFQLSGGFRLLVGRDLEERERLFEIVATAGRWSVTMVIVL